jgi:hypothetical protein
VPTYDKTATFSKDWAALGESDRTRFREAVRAFVEDLWTADHGFRPGLRVRGVQGARGVFEVTWAPDGRATFEYGPPQIDGEPHVIWRRVGTHDIFGSP